MTELEQYIEQVEQCISENSRWDALRLIRDVRHDKLTREQQNDLYDLEMLAEESR